MKFTALALLLALAAPLPALAAEAAPEALARQAAGVVGSGDQLALQLSPPGGPPRILHIGEMFEDGWTLTALTATAATLSREGASRTVGLNPTGALASVAPAGPPTTVRVTGLDIPPEVQVLLDLTDEQVLARFPPAMRDQVAGIITAAPGLSLEQTRRQAMLTLRYYLMTPALNAATQAQVAAARAAGIDAHASINPVETLSALYPDYAQIEAVMRAGAYQANLARYASAQAAGLSTVRVAAQPLQPGQTSAAFVLPPELEPYSPVLMAAAVTNDARILVLTPPSDAPVSDVPLAPPVLSPTQVAGLRDAAGAPLSTEAQAAILTANRDYAAANAAAQAQASSGVGYGPFGPVAR